MLWPNSVNLPRRYRKENSYKISISFFSFFNKSNDIGAERFDGLEDGGNGDQRRTGDGGGEYVLGVGVSFTTNHIAVREAVSGINVSVIQ